MINRKSGLVFLLLANIVLLVHAFVPHHHHNERICFLGNQCENECTPCNHDTQDHEHEGNNASTVCVLKQAVVLPSSQDKLVIVYSESANQNLTDHLLTIIDDFDGILIPTVFYCRTYPEYTSSYISYVTRNLGLRAPPTV